MRSTIVSSTSSGTCSSRATAARVMSSSVGPSPPVITITSAHASAARNSSASSSTSSPATSLSRTSMPISLSRSVMNSEFVSTRNGVNISVPTATMQAPIDSTRSPRGSASARRAARGSRRRRHRIVGHRPRRPERFEPVGGKQLIASTGPLSAQAGPFRANVVPMLCEPRCVSSKAADPAGGWKGMMMLERSLI